MEKGVPIPITKTEYINTFKYDSIYVHDSIDRLVKGDTILIQKWHTKYKEKIIKDTVIIRDSIPYYITITKVVEKNKLNFMQQLFVYLGIFTLVAFILYLIKMYKR